MISNCRLVNCALGKCRRANAAVCYFSEIRQSGHGFAGAPARILCHFSVKSQSSTVLENIQVKFHDHFWKFWDFVTSPQDHVPAESQPRGIAPPRNCTSAGNAPSLGDILSLITLHLQNHAKRKARNCITSSSGLCFSSIFRVNEPLRSSKVFAGQRASVVQQSFCGLTSLCGLRPYFWLLANIRFVSFARFRCSGRLKSGSSFRSERAASSAWLSTCMSSVMSAICSSGRPCCR